jgi:hypothetical protein
MTLPPSAAAAAVWPHGDGSADELAALKSGCGSWQILLLQNREGAFWFLT